MERTPTWLARTSQNVRRRHAAMGLRERTAVWLTITAALCGVIFALGDPNLAAWSRSVRLLIDTMVVLGVVAYLNEPPRPRAVRRGIVRWLVRAERVLIVLLTTLAIVFTALVPGVDPWLKAYRLSLSVVLLVAVSADARRPMARKFFAGIMAAQILFAGAETATMMYVAIAVDGPIAYRTVQEGAKQLTARLVTTGIPASPRIGAIVMNDEGVLLRYDDVRRRIVGTNMMSDLLHWTHGDPFAAILDAMQVMADRGVPRLLTVAQAPTPLERCRVLDRIDPPLTGYRMTSNLAMANQTRMWCARHEGKVTTQDAVFENIAAAIRQRERDLRGRKPDAPCNAEQRDLLRIEILYGSLLEYGEGKRADPRQRARRARLHEELTGTREAPGKSDPAIEQGLVRHLAPACRHSRRKGETPPARSR